MPKEGYRNMSRNYETLWVIAALSHSCSRDILNWNSLYLLSNLQQIFLAWPCAASPLPPFKDFPSTAPHTKKFHSSSRLTVVCLLSFFQSHSLPSSYAIPSSWIRRLSELAGSAPLLCVVPHLRDLCSVLFGLCTFCPCPYHRCNLRAGDTPCPGNSHPCVPCSIPTAQKIRIFHSCAKRLGGTVV